MVQSENKIYIIIKWFYYLNEYCFFITFTALSNKTTQDTVVFLIIKPSFAIKFSLGFLQLRADK